MRNLLQRPANIDDDHVWAVYHDEGKDVKEHGRLDSGQPSLLPHQGREYLSFRSIIEG